MTAMPSRRGGARGSEMTRGPRTHEGPSGFSWTVTLPERSCAPMGSRKPLATVALDGGESLGVPVPVARRLDSPRESEPASRAELLYRIRELSDECAWAKLVDLVSRRDYSRKEASDRLSREGYSASCVEQTVQRACESRIINDARFAEYFVRAKVSAGWGPLRIKRELSHRGISVEDVPGWPDEFFDDGGPAERAREVLSSKTIPEKNAYAKLVRFLVSRGYPLSVAKDAVSDRLSDARVDG